MQAHVAATWVFLVYQVALILGGVATATISALGVRHRSDSRAVALTCLTAAMAEWSLFYALELIVPGPGPKLSIARLEYAGIIVVPVAWFATAASFARLDRWISSRRLVILSIIPLFSLLLIWTNDLHSLFWTDVSLAPAGPFWVVSFARGAAFWLHTAYSYALLFAGSYLLAARIFAYLATVPPAGACASAGRAGPMV